MIELAAILAFATWRVASLLHNESPFSWLRNRIGIVEDDATNTMSYPCNWLGEVWECFWCLSLCVAFVFAVATYTLTDLGLFETFLVWLASAGGALVLDVRYFARLRN